MSVASIYRIRVRAAIRRPPDEVLVAIESQDGRASIRLPGGVPRTGETLESALIRSVREETGYETIPTDIAFVTERGRRDEKERALDVVFYAEIVVGNPSAPPRGAASANLTWLGYDDPRLIRFVPEAKDFTASRKGRYNRSDA